MCYLPSSLTDIKGFACFVTNQHCVHKTCGTKYSRMDQVTFFKGCLPQISLGLFLNIWTHVSCLFKYLVTDAVFIRATECMKIKSIFSCSFMQTSLQVFTWHKNYQCNISRMFSHSQLNPFVPNAPFLYPLETSENSKVFLMFSGDRERVHWERMG